MSNWFNKEQPHTQVIQMTDAQAEDIRQAIIETLKAGVAEQYREFITCDFTACFSNEGLHYEWVYRYDNVSSVMRSCKEYEELRYRRAIADRAELKLKRDLGQWTEQTF